MHMSVVYVCGVCADVDACVCTEAGGEHLVSCSMTLPPPHSFETGLLTEPGVMLAPESPSSPVSIPQCWITDMRQCLAFYVVQGF